MRNQSRFPWNQVRKSAQPSSPTHFYNMWCHFWGKSRGNRREIRKSHTPKLLVANPSVLCSLRLEISMLLIPEQYTSRLCCACSSKLKQTIDADWVCKHSKL